MTILTDYLFDTIGNNYPSDTLVTSKSLQTETSLADNAALRVYPNPTDDILYVEMSGAGIKSVGLHDLTGRTVAGVADAGGRPLVEINVGGIPAGVYVLRVTDTNGCQYQRKSVVK